MTYRMVCASGSQGNHIERVLKMFDKRYWLKNLLSESFFFWRFLIIGEYFILVHWFSESILKLSIYMEVSILTESVYF